MKILEISKKKKKTNLLAAIVFMIFGLALILIGLIYGETISGKLFVSFIGILFSGISIYTYFEVKRLNYKIQLSDVGISKVLQDGKLQSLNWDSISGIKFRDRVRKLLLFDNKTNIKFEIDYQLENFPLLELYLAQKVEGIRIEIINHYKANYSIDIDLNQLMASEPVF